MMATNVRCLSTITGRQGFGIAGLATFRQYGSKSLSVSVVPEDKSQHPLSAKDVSGKLADIENSGENHVPIRTNCDCLCLDWMRVRLRLASKCRVGGNSVEGSRWRQDPRATAKLTTALFEAQARCRLACPTRQPRACAGGRATGKPGTPPGAVQTGMGGSRISDRRQSEVGTQDSRSDVGADEREQTARPQ